MKLGHFAAATLLASAFAAGSPSAQNRPTDWPQWRGPNRDGVIPSFTEPKPWPEKLTRKWKVDAGLGYATPVVIGNRVFMFGRLAEQEVLDALDADTGKDLWHMPLGADVKSAAISYAVDGKQFITIPAGGDMKFVMAYKLDTKANPVTIDMEIKEGPVPEGKAKGIIAIEGEQLKLCYHPTGGDRPKKFEATKDNGAFYFVLKKAAK